MLSAELVPGEQIYARGRLARSDIAAPGAAYREVKWGWALHPAGGQMLLSSEPLGAGLRARAAFHRRFGWLALGLVVATQLTLVAFYGRVGGDTVTARVAGMHTYETTDDDDHTHQHYVVDLDPEVHLSRRSVEVSGSEYAVLLQGATLPVRRASATNWNLGASPTIAIWHAAAIAFAPFAFWLAYLSRRRSSRPWFRRKVTERGAGRLDGSE